VLLEVVPEVMEVMKNFPWSEGVQQWGCYALSKLVDRQGGDVFLLMKEGWTQAGGDGHEAFPPRLLDQAWYGSHLSASSPSTVGNTWLTLKDMSSS